MATATAVSAGIGAAGGVAKFFEGRKMQRRAQKMIENFEWKELRNPYKDLQVSTMGADLQREEAARMSATNVDALRSGGNRALIGGLGRVQAQNNLVNRQIAADLDQQQKQIDYAAAQDDTMIRAMHEKRQADELQGYGQMMNVGLGMKYQGVGDVMNAAGMIGQMNMDMFNSAAGAATGNPQAPQGTAQMTTNAANQMGSLNQAAIYPQPQAQVGGWQGVPYAVNGGGFGGGMGQMTNTDWMYQVAPKGF